MKISIKKIISNKRLFVVGAFVVLILLLSVLNLAFSAFTNKQINNISNIKVSGMDYSISINGNQTTMITITNNITITSNVTITSLNNIDSKYELIYNVCTDINCNNIINKPEDLSIEYSSRTVDAIFGSINKHAAKNIRIISVNETNQTYYIKLDLNAGYIHNTLALKKLIIDEYNEEDIIIAATILGEISTTFPTTDGYTTKVTCTTNNGPSNATGTATWNGTKWVVNITGADSGRTICNVDFNLSLNYLIIAQGGGVDAIVARGTPDFNVINGTSGIYASEDEYGTSYYYRGLKTDINNNLLWGGYQWKIIRINGNGTIRLLYNGTEAVYNEGGSVNDIGPNTQISTSAWNQTQSKDAKYVGYMYGGANGVTSTMRYGTTSAAATFNETSTIMKTNLEKWYKTNILDKGLAEYVEDNHFCNDRQFGSEVGGTSTGPGYGFTESTVYAARYRLYNNKIPTLYCVLENDRFTVNNTSLGNGTLTYPVGLLTADEVSMSGLVYRVINKTNYLYNGASFYLLSPDRFTSNGSSYVYAVNDTGQLYDQFSNAAIGVRPVLSIKRDVKVSGTGSSTDPFRVTS